MVEQIGSGISRIKTALKKANLKPAVFKTSGLFTVVFTRTTNSIYVSPPRTTREKVLHLLKSNEKITTEEMALTIGVTSRSIEYHLERLKKDGIIYREGSKKTGSWIIRPSE